MSNMASPTEMTPLQLLNYHRNKKSRNSNGKQSYHNENYTSRYYETNYDNNSHYQGSYSSNDYNTYQSNHYDTYNTTNNDNNYSNYTNNNNNSYTQNNNSHKNSYHGGSYDAKYKYKATDYGTNFTSTRDNYQQNDATYQSIPNNNNANNNYYSTGAQNTDSTSFIESHFLYENIENADKQDRNLISQTICFFSDLWHNGMEVYRNLSKYFWRLVIFLTLVIIILTIVHSFFFNETSYTLTSTADKNRFKHNPTTSEPFQPHIIWIIADDLGYSDVSYNGAEIKTSNIDYLASQGVVLTQHYVQPLGAPTRASLMTGRFAFRMGLQAATTDGNIMLPGTSVHMNDAYQTVAQVLQKNGYKTFAFGCVLFWKRFFFCLCMFCFTLFRLHCVCKKKIKNKKLVNGI